MMNKKDENLELTPEQKDRLNKLKVILEKFEETALVYGPASAGELKNRINKIIRSFDDEFKSLLNSNFNYFWSSNSNVVNKKENDCIVPDLDIPKFLRNYKK